MTAAIIPFDFETNAVRVVKIDDAPWFVAADICRVLEHRNPTVALNRLDEDEKQIINPKNFLGPNGSRGGAQAMNVVSESGLYALIVTSTKPAAKRFRKWVTAEVLPAIRRDGFYMAAPTEQQELEAKRSYYRALPEVHRERADARAAALVQAEELITGGMRVGQALETVASETGLSVRSLYAYRRGAYMVARSDWGAALAPRWNGPRAMLTECNPEALEFFLSLCRTGMRVSDCIRRLHDVATERGWIPIPPDRTLYRVAGRFLPRPPKAKEVA